MYETVVCPTHQVWKLVQLTEKDPLQDVSQLVDMLPNTVIHKDMEDFEFLGTKSTEITVQFKDK